MVHGCNNQLVDAKALVTHVEWEWEWEVQVEVDVDVTVDADAEVVADVELGDAQDHNQ